MNDVLPFAENILSKHGRFFTYGGAMKPDGEIVRIAAYEGREHHRLAICLLYWFQRFQKEIRRAGKVVSRKKPLITHLRC